ncbi:MAG: dCTP deaminase [Candidatus Aenigmarchaeota archaeon]|nr:dCTP deaminase [Candidatus Aenigmarchaeota archaeon]
MILSDRDLKKLISAGNVYVTDGVPPINVKTQLGPSSIDLRLGDHFIIFQNTKTSLLDTKNMNLDGMTSGIHATPEEGIVIHPGQFILGTTMEFLKIPDDMAARIEGRSSYGRLGIAVHSTAGYCDPGWEGQVTLEIQNLGVVPVRLYPGERVCQVVFQKMTSEADVPYGKKHDAKYMKQSRATASKLHMEKH